MSNGVHRSSLTWILSLAALAGVPAVACGSGDEKKDVRVEPGDGGAAPAGGDGQGATSGKAGSAPNAGTAGTAGSAGTSPAVAGAGGEPNVVGTGGDNTGGAPDTGAGGAGGAGGTAPTVAMVVVTPHYVTNGPFWNDYVKADGTGRFDASGAACDPSTDGPTYDACIHGGEVRRVELSDAASCTGLTALDALGAFDWSCLENGGHAWMVSSALKPAKHLADLIDFAAGAWRENTVTVSAPAGVIAMSEPAIWWQNPVRLIQAGTIAVAPHDVLLTRAGASGLISTNTVDKVALVSEPGTANAGQIALRGHFNWVEGRVVDALLSAQMGGFVVVRGGSAVGTSGNRFVANSLRASVIDDLLVTNSAAASSLHNVNFTLLSGTRVRHVTSAGAGYYGIFLGSLSSTVVGAANSSFEDMQDTGSQGGFAILHTTGTSFKRLLSEGTAAFDGFNIDGSVAGCSFEDLTSHSAKSIGITTKSDSSTYRRLKSISSAQVGFDVGTTKSTIDDVLVANSAGNSPGAVNINTVATAISNLRVFGNVATGVVLGGTIATTRLANVLVAGSDMGFNSSVNTNGGGVVVQNLTLANVGFTGTAVTGTAILSTNPAYKVMSNVLGVNTVRGLTISTVFGNPYPRFRNLVLVGSDNEEISLSNNADIQLEGKVNLGRDGGGSVCSASALSVGMTDTCMNEAPSSATFTSGFLDTDVFVGPVTADGANASDTNGQAAFATTLDFEHFDSVERGWGKTGASSWPGVDQRGRCKAADTCQIYDFSLKSIDTAALNIAAIPTGNDVRISYDKGSESSPASQADCDTLSPGSKYAASLCETTYVQDAVEVPFDGIGDDDTLCESNETCVYSPNAGFYQGHGALVSAGTFTDGIITGVTLLKYATNGR
jgi:hypothetical protein